MLLNCGVGEDSCLLDCKEITPVKPKGNQPCTFIGRTDAEAEIPILWPPDVKNRFIWKDPNTGKDWRQEEKGLTGDEMVWWHHWLNGHEFESTLGVGDGQGSLAWGWKPSVHEVALSWTWLSDWTDLNRHYNHLHVFQCFIFFILHIGLPQWLSGKEAACNAADVG